MGFFNALRRSLGGEKAPEYTPREIEARFLGVDPDSMPIAEEVPFESGVYDRSQWSRKLKRVLSELPGSQGEWEDVASQMGRELDVLMAGAQQAWDRTSSRPDRPTLPPRCGCRVCWTRAACRRSASECTCCGTRR